MFGAILKKSVLVANQAAVEAKFINIKKLFLCVKNAAAAAAVAT
jgi:hypothetical protein